MKFPTQPLSNTMKLEMFFRIITIFGLIAIVIFIANAASANQTNLLYRLTPEDVKLRNEMSKGVAQIEHTPKANAPLVDKNYNRPTLSSKVIRIEKKKRKPINIESKIKIEGREYNPNDRKLEEKFWTLSLEEKRKYPMLLRKRFINAKRKREYEEWQKKNPNRTPKPLPPYDAEEMAIIKSDNRRPSRAIRLDGVKFGKVSNQSKIGNKVINLEVK